MILRSVKNFSHSSTLLLAVIVLFVLLDPFYLVQGLEEETIAFRIRRHYRETTTELPLTVVEIDDESLRRLKPEMGEPPWPRSVFAKVVEYLAENGAQGVAFHIPFVLDEVPVKLNSTIFRDALRKHLAEQESQLETFVAEFPVLFSREQDASFRSALDRIPNILPLRIDSGFANSNRQQAAVLDAAACSFSTPPKKILSVPSVSFPSSRVSTPKTEIGFLAFRRPERPTMGFPLWLQVKGVFFPSLPLAIAGWTASLSGNSGGFTGNGRARCSLLRNLGEQSAANADETILVNYYRNPKRNRKDRAGRFEVFPGEPLSFADLWHDAAFDNAPKRLSRDRFSGRIVLIGPARKRIRTPLGVSLPYTRILANATATLLDPTSLRLPPRWLGWLLTVLTAFLAWWGMRRNLVWGVTSLAGSGVLLLGAAAVLMNKGFLLPVAAPLLASSIFLLSDWTYHQFEEKRRLRLAFQKYVAPSVMREILKDPSALTLVGRKTTATVLFSDIKHFSRWAMELPSEDLVRFLNTYFTRMTEKIVAFDGTIDKMIGDAVMAEWNVPLHQEKHAVLACSCALEKRRAVAELAQTWASGVWPNLGIRIGIHTGEVVAGNLGSETIFDYTVIGTTVNIASRLESLNRDLGTTILTSGETKQEVEKCAPNRFYFRTVGVFRLRGQKAALDVYELVDETARLPKSYLEVMETWEKGVRAYREKDVARAKESITEVARRLPYDGPAVYFLERMAEAAPGEPFQQG
ncbi:MAG: adenylate/guanylate cyclase domain-containing protein [Candidatus Hydrogenedentota bacterium]|nr:MAG: adenylate/guanylate cyclase domain-containing protein [Candidatus Hydrogenedentota bacterium]